MNLTPLAAYVDLDVTLKRFMDDSRFYLEMLSGLIQEYNTASAELGLAIQQSEPEHCRQMAHYFRGIAANLGLAGAVEFLQTIEKSSAAGDWTSTKSANKALNAYLKNIQQAIDEIETRFRPD